MRHQLAKYEIHAMRLPYSRPVKWAGHVETEVDIVLLLLRTHSGITGVAETPVRLKWHSATVRSFVATLEDVVLPAIGDVDLVNEEAVMQRLSAIREQALAKNLVDAACWDLRSHAAGLPLWKSMGATAASVPVSCTLTRGDPKSMAAEAASAVEDFGVAAFKVKTGRGAEVDGAVLSEIRHAVGPGVALFADSNGAHDIDQLATVSQILAEHEVAYFEDPCKLMPTRQLRDVKSRCALPILVDNGCRSLRDARLFLEAGAEALSVKTMKTGISESLAIAAEARRAGAKIAVGISASSALGAIPALSLAQSLPVETRGIPCEETFFLTAGGYLHEPLRLAGGCVALPEQAGLEGLIDWKRVASLKP